MNSLVDTVRATVDRHRLLPELEPVVAMVSGGADSTALLRLLASGQLGELQLSVLHVNHLLRGEDADADEAFVESLCSELGVAYRGVRVDVGVWASAEGLNLEDAGRQVRYRIAGEELDARLAAAGLPPDAGVICTAHTLDDRIETFFMRALSGSGTGALASIKYRRDRIARPLLDAERAAITAYLRELGQAWREDVTNEDTERYRAAVRHGLIPAAEQVNPAFRPVLRRTLAVLADDDEVLAGLAAAHARTLASASSDRSVEFDRAGLARLPRALARRAIRQTIVEAFPSASRLESLHIDSIVDGLGDDHYARDLPGGLRAFGEYDKLVVLRTGERPPAVAPSLLPVPGEADLGDAGTILAESVEPGDVSGTPDSVVIDADSVSFLTVDGVREGDRMRPLGLAGSRKLSDMLTDAKVPRRLRRAMPVVRDGESIVWLAGVRMSERNRVTPSTRRALRLTWKRD
ncbi:MAG: tRNA lysidine(34) synthetase TilS [Coriobacteriales bacterium]|nr:tRNA lysidine(34) synthetase TilS [Coriobacteriales bacterium]